MLADGVVVTTVNHYPVTLTLALCADAIPVAESYVRAEGGKIPDPQRKKTH